MGVQVQGRAHFLLGCGSRGELNRREWRKCLESLGLMESGEFEEKEIKSSRSQTLEFTGSESELGKGASENSETKQLGSWELARPD